MNTHSPEMLESIAKTRHGIVPLATILHGFRYVPWKSIPGLGSWLDKDDTREAFCSVEWCKALGPVAHSFTSIKGRQHGLVARPVDASELVWCADHPVGSFAVIPWPHVGLALVARRAPPTYVGTEWWAFVSLEDLAQTLQAVNPHREAQQ